MKKGKIKTNQFKLIVFYSLLAITFVVVYMLYWVPMFQNIESSSTIPLPVAGATK